ncbi:MAG: hypothetical protein KGH71_01610 [Candidatus Micrarchaeota archaeon]|nr:hypothetical protein [Candidatus Micrarchaeota archaeon]
MLESMLGLIVGIVASAITVVLIGRYMKSKRLYLLLWALGMLLWAISAFAQAYAILFGWSVPLYKLYYFAAVALAGFLGAGTLGIITKRERVFLGFAALMTALSLILAISLALTPIDQGLLNYPVVGANAVPISVRILAPIINIPAAVAFIGGAAYSFIRSRKMYALFITLGATVPAIGGTLAGALIPWALPFTDFIGIAFLASGFYLSFTQPALKDQQKEEGRK